MNSWPPCLVRTGGTQYWQDCEVASDDAPMAALAEVLSRRCLGEPRRGDAETARQLMGIVAQSGAEPEILAVAAASVGCAPDDSRTIENLDGLRETARRLLRGPLTMTEQFLVVVS